MNVADVLVIGGGIAGLSAAYGLAARGVRRVRLLEREDALCMHSSGRNAAIFRMLATAPGDLELGRRSREMYTALLGSEAAWLERTGNWFVSETPEPLDAFVALATREHIPFERLEGAALVRVVPQIEGGESRHGLFFPEDGIIDINEISQALARGASRAGVEISLRTEVAGLEVEAGKITGARLASGERISAGAVVVAGGAWAQGIGASCGAPLVFTPLRRHLAILEIRTPLRRNAPIVWHAVEQAYLRPETGGILASPGDEEPWVAELPPVSLDGLELLAVKLGRLAPRYADGGVRRSWACLRTFAKDRTAVVGPDPRVEGLYWLAGLGGHGMTGGAAAGELLACTYAGVPHPLASTLAPARLL